jgi:hypothetical protein
MLMHSEARYHGFISRGAPSMTAQGQKATSPIHRALVRSTSDIGHLGVRHVCQQRANFRLAHRSKQQRYSITSSARPISVLGTLMPSALAVVRLMISSILVAC